MCALFGWLWLLFVDYVVWRAGIGWITWVDARRGRETVGGAVPIWWCVYHMTGVYHMSPEVPGRLRTSATKRATIDGGNHLRLIGLAVNRSVCN